MVSNDSILSLVKYYATLRTGSKLSMAKITVIAIVITSWLTKLLWQGDREGTFLPSSQAATCPPVYHTPWRLHTLPLIAERHVEELRITTFVMFCFGFTIDSLLVDWKLTGLPYFLHGLVVLKYADSSDQHDFFLCGSLALRICPIKSVEYAWPQKPLQQEQTFFLQCTSLFLRASVFSLLNKQSMAWLNWESKSDLPLQQQTLYPLDHKAFYPFF